MSATTEVCPSCEHSMDAHFEAKSGRIVCLHSSSGVSDRGVMGIPWTHRCDCRDLHSDQGERDKEYRAKKAAEDKRRQDELVAAFRVKYPELVKEAPVTPLPHTPEGT